MDYCGIDLAGVSSYVYVTNDRGRKLTAGEVATDRAAFERRLKRFVRDGLSIAIEAGNQTAWVYDALIEMGAKVTVVNPTKIKLIAASRRKTATVWSWQFATAKAPRTGTCHCRNRRWSNCAATGFSNARRIGCSPARRERNRSAAMSSEGVSKAPPRTAASPRTYPATRCAIRMPRTCLKTGSTCG